MGVFTVKEATKFFRSYGVKCEEELVLEWVRDTNTKLMENQVCEDDLYRFNDWCRWKDTAYEEGINDQTKIARLLEENAALKREISSLRVEKAKMEDMLGISPF